MSFFGMGLNKSKIAPSPTIGLPVSRDVKILAHIWPSDKANFKDLRFHIHSAKPAHMETDVLMRLLHVYGNNTEWNDTTQQVKSIVPNPIIPLLEQKLTELGLNVKWIKIAK
jgi:hypothetical protein